MKKHAEVHVSLIISTYNWPEALEKCLLSVFAQSRMPDEIIIADDGSGSETRERIERLQAEYKIPLLHIWHPDEGFRLGAIRNKAIDRAQGDYIIQIDGDIVLEKHFIADHLRLAQPNAFVCGSRVWVSEQQSAKILDSKNLPEISIWRFPIGSILNGIRIGFLSEYLADRYKKNKPTALRGCNMAFWKSDLMLVNGYNEDIQGWGSEDAELAIRLINSGVKKRFIKFAGIAYHLYHRESDKSLLPKNKAILEKTQVSGLKVTENGIIRRTISEI